MRSEIRFRVYIIGLYLLLLPIDATLGNIFGSISLINYVVILYALVRIFNLATEKIRVITLTNSIIPTIYFLYFMISISWSMSSVLNSWYIFSLLGSFLMFIFAAIDAYSEKEYQYLKKMIIYSGVIVILTTVLNVDLNSGTRFTLDFGREMDPNYFSTGFVLITAVLVDNVLNKRSTKTNLIILVVLFFIIILTGSRGGLIANATVIFSYVLINSKEKLTKKIIPIISGILLFVFTFIVIRDLVPTWVLDRFTFEEMISGGGSGRTIIWLSTLSFFENMPFLGLLFGNGFSTFGHISSIALGIPRAAHSIYIQSLLEGGIFGLLILLSLIFSSMKRSLLNKRHYVFSALIGVAVGGITLDIHVSRFFWVIILFSIITVFKNPQQINTRSL